VDYFASFLRMENKHALQKLLLLKTPIFHAQKKTNFFMLWKEAK